jgi:hypothetical protein
MFVLRSDHRHLLTGAYNQQHPANLLLVDNQMTKIDRKVLALT